MSENRENDALNFVDILHRGGRPCIGKAKYLWQLIPQFWPLAEDAFRQTTSTRIADVLQTRRPPIIGSDRGCDIAEVLYRIPWDA